MPIKIPDSLPATAVLESENIFVMTEHRAMHQDIRPLEVLIVNLMPTKIVTEIQILRKLSNTPLQVHVEFLQTVSHKATHVDLSHLESFYTTFDQIKNRRFDGLIITGAPLDFIEFEQVDYWEEMCQIMEWSRTHVHSTMHMCWGAFAGLYYHYGIKKYSMDSKLFGVFEHKVEKFTSPLFRGMDDVFYAPHSRAACFHDEDIRKVPELEILAISERAGASIMKTQDSSQFFMTCHPEYDADTLALEYYRDLEKGLPIKIPENYFPDDDPKQPPVVRWRSTGQLIFSNWLNYYVYQSTPYQLN